MTLHQQELFANTDSFPKLDRIDAHVPGLIYSGDFLSSAEQAKICSHIESSSWMPDLKRRVQHYGWKYDYTSRAIDSSMFLGELPAWLSAIAGQLQARGWFDAKPDQAIINEYEPGQGIAPHVDCIPCFGPSVASISLLSPIVMDFESDDASGRQSQLLEPGSIVVLSGPARYRWTHGIASRKSDQVGGKRVPRRRRISVTFRTIKRGQH